MDFCQKQVKTDCEVLLSRFQQTQSVRFEVFSGIWRNMNFSHIFYGTLKLEKRPFSRLVLDTASSYFLPPFSFQIRVGGLYLLYSLYHSQPSLPSEQIRLALKDWEDVKKFERDAMEARHLDAVYILRQLMFCKAFHFTAMPTRLVFRKRRKAERSVLCEEFLERASRPQELISVELLEEMGNVHKLYEKQKRSTLSMKSDPSVQLIRKDLVPQLRGAVLDFYKWQHRKDGDDGGDQDAGEGTSSQQESSRRAELLSFIKSKAYGEAAEVCKSRRHRQVELDLTCHETGPAPMSARPRAGKLSLKARTNENIRISGDVWKDAEETTQINRLSMLDSEKKKKVYPRFKWS